MTGTVIKICVIVIGYIVIIKLIDYIINRINKKELHIKFSSSIIKALLGIIALSAIGMQFNTTAEISKIIMQSSGLLVAVAGFAAQEVLADVISGVMLSWSKPFNIGDRIVLKSSNITGVVEDITLRHIVVKTFYNSRLVIPNSIVNKEILENSDYSGDYIGNLLEITIAYQSDIDKASEIIKNTVVNHELTIKDEYTEVQVKELAANGVILKVTVWTKTTDDNFKACSDIRKTIKENFDAEGIKIPYTTFDINIKE